MQFSHTQDWQDEDIKVKGESKSSNQNADVKLMVKFRILQRLCPRMASGWCSEVELCHSEAQVAGGQYSDS